MSEKHRKVQVIVFSKLDDSPKVLLLQMKEDRSYMWQSVTGSVDPGEDWETAAKRELEEETGIKADVKLLDLEFEFHDRWGKDVLEKVYFAISNTHDVKISEEEHQDFKWVEVEQISESDFGYPSNFKAFKEALECAF